MRKYQNIYEVITDSPYRITYDASGAYKVNPSYIDIQRPLWLVLEYGNEHIWISHVNGMYQLRRQDGKQFYFKTQREFLPFLERTLQN